MGTQVHYKSYLPGYYPMMDLNEDSNSSSWPLLYGDKNFSNGQCYAGFMPRTVADAYPGCDKNALKQKILEHEAIFRNQVYELHRLYRIQRDMMEDVKRKEPDRHSASIEPSSSSNLLGSQAPPEDTRKWHVGGYHLTNPGYAQSIVSGADIDNSPLSCTKGNNTLGSRGTYQNGCTSKECEVLETSRPSKVQKRLFDLHLPADEYIDPEDDEQQDTKIFGFSSSRPNREYKVASESSMKQPLRGVASETTGVHVDAFTCNPRLRSSAGLADLNEPIEVEEPTAPSSIDIFGNSARNGWIKGVDLSGKPSLGVLNVQHDVTQRHQQGIHSSPNKLSIENKFYERDWLSPKYETGHAKSNLGSMSNGVQRDKLPLPSTPAHMLNQAHSSGINLIDPRKEDMYTVRAGPSFEASHRNHNYYSNSHLESVPGPQVPSPYQFVGSSNVATSWTKFGPSWGNPTGSLTQKLASLHTHPSPVLSPSLSKSLQSSVQSHDAISRNGFCPGSSSGSKDIPVSFPSVGLNYLNGCRSDNISSGHLNNHESEKSQNGYKCIDQKPARGINLNVALLNNSSNVAAQRQDEIIDQRGKHEAQQAVLPWLRGKSANKNEGPNSLRDVDSIGSDHLHASRNSLCGKTGTVKDLNQMVMDTSASGSHEFGRREEKSENHGGRTILGIPIFEKVSAPINDQSSLFYSPAAHHPTSQVENVKHEVKDTGIDINVACDSSLLESDDKPAREEMVVEKAFDKDATCVKNFIDLNSCVTEDDDPPIVSVLSNVASVKVVLDIDLEALPVSEAEEDFLPEKETENEQESAIVPPDHKMEQAADELLRGAAEAIVEISSSCPPINLDNSTCQPDASLAEPLLWFANVVTVNTDEFLDKSGKEMKGREDGPKESASWEIDDFEAMILQLPETNEEDYMPKPFIPEVKKVEEIETNSLPARPRRGQARRGRQRKDFQRDILPGLASLSRHEVTEDLQTFGGIMKATGHPWNSGLTRRNGSRNGSTRGRRKTVVENVPTAAPGKVCNPLMQKLNNNENGLEDHSLTGWGKTPRRPRRQRCPAGKSSDCSINLRM